MKKIIIILCLIILSGCAAVPIGNLTDEDFITKEVQLSGGYQSCYRNLINGLRMCDILGVPVGNLYTDIDEAHIDLYMGSSNDAARAGKHAYGTITFKEVDSSLTLATFKLVKRSIYKLKNETILNSWISFSNGIYECPN